MHFEFLVGLVLQFISPNGALKRRRPALWWGCWAFSV